MTEAMWMTLMLCVTAWLCVVTYLAAIAARQQLVDALQHLHNHMAHAKLTNLINSVSENARAEVEAAMAKQREGAH